MSEVPVPEAAADKSSAARPLAVIDMGSNSVRMVVAQVLPDGRLELLERVRRAVRLGQDTFVRGRLSQRTMAAALAIMRDCRRILDTYGVREVRAVATSAVREALNADAFLDRIFLATGLEVEVIEPSEEGRLTVNAVLEAMGAAAGLQESYALIVDVGGGSALLTFLKRGQITISGSYAMGSIRLQEMLATSQEPADRAAGLLRHQIESVVASIKKTMPLGLVEYFVAVGGDARFTAAQIGKPLHSADLATVQKAPFERFVEKCTSHTADELARLHRIPYADAETLVPALLVYDILLNHTQATEMIVSSVSMRDGLLLDMMRMTRGEEPAQLRESIIQAARSLGEKYQYDEAHSLHVADLACRLFDELRKEHGLGDRHRLLLRLAGILHDIGTFVSVRSHHKHSYYLIANSELYGLQRAELNIVALVSRYHRRSSPKPTHLEYMSLSREHRMAVSKLAAILRVADALDRGHAQQVRDIRFERDANELIVYVAGLPDLTLERRAMAPKSDLFMEIFGLGLRLETAQF